MRRGDQKGFTIIEIAVVMIIIGLLVGAGASLIKPLTDRAKRTETKETVMAAVESVIGYAAANGNRLPDATLFSGVVRKQNDAWANPIQYIYDTNLDVNNTNSDCCGRKTSRITLRKCDDAGCTSFTDIPDVAFIVLSGGGNYNNQTAAGQAISAATVINIYGVEIVVDNYAGDIGGSARAEGYDDIVEWVTVNELRSRLDCQGPPLAILNNELPPGDVGGTYSAAIYADGGVPFTGGGGNYKWCMETESGNAPSNLVFRDHTDTVSMNFDTDCGSLSESSPVWVQSDHVIASGSPSTSGSFRVVVYARDDNNAGNDSACSSSGNLDNCARKSLVVTVSP